MTRYQYEISLLVPQTSFRGETVGRFAKCRLLSHARPSEGFTLLLMHVTYKRLDNTFLLLGLSKNSWPALRVK